MALPFAQHLNTNYVPSDEEILEISHILLAPKTDLDKLNAEIERTKAILDGLTHQRDELGRKIDQYHALTSHARRLPRDILQEIFVNCLPTDRNTNLSTREAPLLLGYICSRWRSISSSTPYLWTRLRIPTVNASKLYNLGMLHGQKEALSRRTVEFHTTAVREWLKRSGSLPLDISLGDGWDEIPVVDANSPSIVDIVLSVAQRWRMITIPASGRSLARFLAQSPHDLPFLESLDFDSRGSRSWPINVPVSAYNICRAPTLRTLALRYLPGNCLQLPVTWAQLTGLTIEGMAVLSASDAFDLFSRCPRLVRCRLDLTNVEKIPRQFFPVELLNLETLYIVEEVNATDLFSHLDLPALRDLEYHTIARNYGRPSVLTLLRKLGGAIQEFATDPQLLDRGSLMECLQLIPNTSTLTFKQLGTPSLTALSRSNNPTILDKRLLYSFLPSAGNPLCPKLKSLNISSKLELSDEELLGFIQEKQQTTLSHVAKLERVGINFRRARRMDMEPHIAHLVEEGLNIHLTYKGSGL